MSHGVVHFEIPGNDPDKLAGFYRDLFDWNIDRVPMDGMDYWVVRTVDTSEQGMPTEPGAINGGITQRLIPQQRPINYVNVESVDDYIQKAKALGATVTVEKMAVAGMGWFAQLIDPQGNPFAIWQDTAAQ